MSTADRAYAIELAIKSSHPGESGYDITARAIEIYAFINSEGRYAPKDAAKADNKTDDLVISISTDIEPLRKQLAEVGELFEAAVTEWSAIIDNSPVGELFGRRRH